MPVDSDMVHDHDYDPGCRERLVEFYPGVYRLKGACLVPSETSGGDPGAPGGAPVGDCATGPLGGPQISDPVNHPSHYQQYPIEVIEITERLNFLLGNVVKYVLRADYKGKPLEDLKKAAWYLHREIANRESGVSA